MRVDNLDHWEPPPEGVLKINFDGASKENPDHAGFDGAIRDHKSEIIQIFYGSLGNDTSNVTELDGLVEGLDMDERRNILPLILEGVSYYFIHGLQNS